jgi:hypothetical protein
VVDRMFGVHAPPPPPPPPPPPSKPAGWDRFNGYPTLKVGSTDASSGGKVSILQRSLNLLGNNLRVDGHYGERTKAIVQVFQRNRKLAADGVVGATTWHWLGVALGGRRDINLADPLEQLPPDHDQRAALSETHALHPGFHFNQGELGRPREPVLPRAFRQS